MADDVTVVCDERDALGLGHGTAKVVDETRDGSPVVAERREMDSTHGRAVMLLLDPDLHAPERSPVR
jgi:hypothetical protein